MIEPYKAYSTGDTRLDQLITTYSNSTFACGEYRDPGEDPGYDEDRAFPTYEAACVASEDARKALYDYLRERLASQTGASRDG
jgi:hypothetical protein